MEAKPPGRRIVHSSPEFLTSLSSSSARVPWAGGERARPGGLGGQQDDPAHPGLSEGPEDHAEDRERLKGLVETWVGQRDIAARYGCPTGTLAAELDERGEGGLDAEAGRVIRLLLDWTERQFRDLGLPEPDGLALTLVGAYQGMSLLANALRDPEIMTREGTRLLAWLDSLHG